ncbi:MAG: hypothetical protein JNK20_01270 [Flavipsychrobacter sp.]|jgi:hypothetical protein|nr:hypothetical protein [Flavipsychrobacter sp.]
MQIHLVDGHFTVAEAEKILNALVKAKVAFHEERLALKEPTIEEVLESERRIKDIRNEFCKALVRVHASGSERIHLQAGLDIDFIAVMDYA